MIVESVFYLRANQPRKYISCPYGLDLTNKWAVTGFFLADVHETLIT